MSKTTKRPARQGKSPANHNQRLIVDYMPTSELKGYHRQLRKPGKKQIEKTINLISTSGIPVPIVVDAAHRIIIGWHFAEAARHMNIEEVPVVIASHLDEMATRTLRIAYERIYEDAEWEKSELAAEFHEIEVMWPDIDLSIATAFECAENRCDF